MDESARGKKQDQKKKKGIAYIVQYPNKLLENIIVYGDRYSSII